MLEEQDLQKIGKLITDSEKRIVENVVVQVGELLETNLLPDLHELKVDVKGLKGDVQTLKGDVKEVKETMKTLADKASINRMMDQSIERDQKLDVKIHTMGDFLAKHQTLSAGEIASLHAIKVVITPQTAQ